MRTLVIVFGLLVVSCTTGNQWEIPDDPLNSCRKMCEGWDMELAGMVGVGQGRNAAGMVVGERGPAATACVCKVPGSTATYSLLAQGASAAVAGPVVEAQQRAAAQQAQQLQQINQNQ